MRACVASARRVRFAAALLVLAAAPAPSQAPAAALAVRRAIASGHIMGAHRADFAHYRPELLRLYSDSLVRPLWIRDDNLTAQGEALLGALAVARSRGLRPDDYDVGILAQSSATDGAIDEFQRLRFDAAMTLSAMRFIDHTHRGRVDPRTFRFALGIPHRVHDLGLLVRSMSAASSVRTFLDSLEPPFSRYQALARALPAYRQLARDPTLWAIPVPRSAIRPGQAWAGAPSVRRLLTALGDGPASSSALAHAGDTLDAPLVESVRRFQRRHGLQDDGVLGTTTVRALRTPLTQRVAQIELTMERWRWLPDIEAERLIVVNLPSFRLVAIDRTMETDEPVERMDVIVGSAAGHRATPVFTATMRDVVFQPYWDVPPSIARQEEIPRLRRDHRYAARQGLEIVRGGDVGATRYPVTNANLDRVGAGALRLRQRPGAGNALGQVKFVFPNPYNVYLHGTPAQSLFTRARRDFSHGCIRTSDPAALAQFVLAGQDGWDSTRIAEAMRLGAPLRRIRLERPVTVFVLYATAVADDRGHVSFHDDIYGHDASLARVIPTAPEGPFMRTSP